MHNRHIEQGNNNKNNNTESSKYLQNINRTSSMDTMKLLLHLPDYYSHCTIWYTSAATMQLCIKQKINNTQVEQLWERTQAILESCIDNNPIVNDAIKIGEFQSLVSVYVFLFVSAEQMR
jgi:hypothetical protein